MHRSRVCFFSLVATCDVPGTCPTQRLPLFFNPIQMGPRKTTIVLRRSTNGEVYKHSVKTRKNIFFCIRTSMPAEHWDVPRVSYMCRNSIPPVVCSVVSLSCVVVEYPCLVFPGPLRTILSQLGVHTCAMGFCMQGFVSIASIEFLPPSLPELL